MDSDKGKVFNVYKGLQRPLIFKSLKGKFIYWGMACMLTAFIAAVVFSTLIHPIAGIVGLIIIALGGMLIIHQKQKKGLHSKTKSAGTYIVTPQFKRIARK
jgi:hypothetical protein